LTRSSRRGPSSSSASSASSISPTARTCGPTPAEVEEVFTIPLAWFVATKPEIYHNRIEIQPSYFDAEGNEHILLPVDKLGLPSHYKERRSEWTHEVAVYRHRRCTIWGLTAGIILGMIRKMR